MKWVLLFLELKMDQRLSWKREVWKDVRLLEKSLRITRLYEKKGEKDDIEGINRYDWHGKNI